MIKVSNLSKKYTLGKFKNSSFRSVLQSLSLKKVSSTEFWALKNVSFEIKQGEVIGIIGKNGAGKSTLLKILSQITKPTEGKIEITGRIASLLEVGTGFHPELSGRENIFLNGTILGMSRKEISEKFNEIVAFSGVEKFLDTPVKNYSSGMYVRLAFAVAAHLEPEILIIDEVLAVGDAEFQKKCMGKMQDVANDGRTVLFVSHNMQAVNTLCPKSILLTNGQVEFFGETQEAIRKYQNSIIESAYMWSGDEGDDNVRLLETKVSSTSDNFLTSDNLDISIKIKVLDEVKNLVIGFHLLSEFDDPIAYTIRGDYNAANRSTLEIGEHLIKFEIPKNTLSKGNYTIRIDLGIHDVKFITHGIGDLTFYLMNEGNDGCRFPVQDIRGYASLFRPHWEK
jgi:lipopolysaccharide transport system ATP-binding protein